jgi:hypothetical protein
MASNVIIYPSGTTSNTNPHFVFDDGTNKLQFNVVADAFTNPTLSLSSSTVSAGLQITLSGSVISSGSSVTSGGLYVANTQMINSSAVWVGPLPGIKGAQGSQGAAGGGGVGNSPCSLIYELIVLNLLNSSNIFLSIPIFILLSI